MQRPQSRIKQQRDFFRKLLSIAILGGVATSFSQGAMAQESVSEEKKAEAKLEQGDNLKVLSQTFEPSGIVLKLNESGAVVAAQVQGIQEIANQEANQAEAKAESSAIAVVQGAPLGKYWLGLGLKKIEGDLATYLGNSDGMLVFEIYPNSPAEKAGWKVGDILLSFRGKPINDFEALLTEINAAESKASDAVLLRQSQKIETNITPEERPNTVPQIEVKQETEIANTQVGGAGESFVFEADMVEDGDSKDGKKRMIWRAVPVPNSKNSKDPQPKIQIFGIEGGELKVPQTALKAVPEINEALKKLKDIDVTKIGEAVTVEVTVDDEQEKEKKGVKTTKSENISVTINRKSDKEPATYSVTINGKKYEGTTDKLQEAPEQVRKLVEKQLAGTNTSTQTITLPGGKTMKITPIFGQPGKSMEVKVFEKSEGKKESSSKDGSEQKPSSKGEATTESSSTTRVIVTTDKNGKLQVTEINPNSGVNEKEVEAMVEKARKQAEAMMEKSGKNFGIGVQRMELKKSDGAKGDANSADKKPSEMKGTIQLRMEAAGSKETEALKKEIAELKKMVEELRAKLDSKKE
jgi:hypothetical protein